MPSVINLTRKIINMFMVILQQLTNLLQPNFTNYRLLLLSIWSKAIINFKQINVYYLRNEHLWLDGFLFDFLQKKSADMWVRKFVIYTGFLFSERLVFDTIIRLYIDYFIFYTHRLSLFEVSNVFEMLTSIIYLAVTLFFIVLLLVLIY